MNTLLTSEIRSEIDQWTNRSGRQDAETAIAPAAR